MNRSDWIPDALPVVRPAVKLETSSSQDGPAEEKPESLVVRRNRPQSPLQRVQEIMTCGLSDEERNEHLTAYLSTLDEDTLHLVAGVLTTLNETGTDITKANSSIWRGIGNDGKEKKEGEEEG